MRSSLKVMLAIDTSTRCIGLALYDGAQVLHEAIWTSNDYHTVELAPAVAEAMRKSGITAQNLGAIAVAIGPGSFTGLRIGLALAKGLSMVHQLPLIGIPTLDPLASAQPLLNIPMAAVLRAGRGRLAVGWYQVVEEHWESAGLIEIFTPAEIAVNIQAETYLCGEINKQERELINSQKSSILLASPARSLRRPAYLAEIAWQRWMSGDVDDPASLAPTYLHYHDPISE